MYITYARSIQGYVNDDRLVRSHNPDHSDLPRQSRSQPSDRLKGDSLPGLHGEIKNASVQILNVYNILYAKISVEGTMRTPMTKIQNDFLGPFVECNGSINRPTAPSSLLDSKQIQAKHVRYTPNVRVKDENGCEEIWTYCGLTSAYKEARDFMPKAEFERFAATACAEILPTMQNVPPLLVKELCPLGYFDFRSKESRDHLALSTALSDAASKRRGTQEISSTAATAPKITFASIPIPGSTTPSGVQSDPFPFLLAPGAKRRAKP